MSSYLISVPHFEDDELIFSEQESRLALAFFWPEQQRQIAAMTNGSQVRRLAQSLMVAAADASSGIASAVDGAGVTVCKPANNLRRLGYALGRQYVPRWYRHATQSQLQNLRIYESVRASLARSIFGTRFKLLLLDSASGTRLSQRARHIAVHDNHTMYWA